MADGPFRHVELEEVRGPRGVTFFGNADGLSIEVKRTFPVLVSVGALSAVAAMVLVDGWLGAVPSGVVLVSAAWWAYSRARRTPRFTSIDMRRGTATIIQRGSGPEERIAVPLADLGPPSLETIVIPRSGLPDLRLKCLQFNHYVDSTPAGARRPLQFLAGYSIENLEWLRTNILSWMATFAGSRVESNQR